MTKNNYAKLLTIIRLPLPSNNHTKTLGNILLALVRKLRPIWQLISINQSIFITPKGSTNAMNNMQKRLHKNCIKTTQSYIDRKVLFTLTHQ